MSIEHITGMGAISGYNDEKTRHEQQDDSASEAYILDHLTQRYNLGRSQAMAVLSAVMGCGSSMTQLAQDLQNNDAAVVALFETFIL